jgi:trigger factor
LKVTRDKEENRQAFLTIEMEPAEMEEGLRYAYERVVQKANIPGFRKGKAPRAVVERTVGKTRLLEEALDHLLPRAYERAIKEQTIEPYAQPELEIQQADPLIFKAVVPLSPAVELGDYRSIRMQPEPVAIKEDNVNAVLEELRHQHATWEPVARALGFDDMAVMDINGEVEEKPYVKKAAAQLQIARDLISPAPGFAVQVVGMEKGEEKEFSLTFPADYPNTSVAGKEGHFKVKLLEIKEEKLPPLDDGLAVQVSPEIKTLDALREEVSKSLKLRAEEHARMDFEEKLINTVVAQARVEYPPVLIDLEINRILNEQARQLQLTGQGMDQYLKSIKKTAEQLQEELRPVATKNITASLVLGKIAQEEKIEVTEADIQNGINNMARNVAAEKKEEFLRLLDTPRTRESLEQSLKTRKTIERLTETVKSTGNAPEETKEEVKNE